MATNSYSQKLRDPRWQKKRLGVLQFHDWSCEACSEKDKTLHVHHKHYVQGREPWDYEDAQLSVLCEDCHEQRHESDKDLHALLAHVDVSGMPGGVDDLYWLIAGFLHHNVEPQLHTQKSLYAVGVVALNDCWLGFQGVEV